MTGLCLTMIVKNEADVITRCLESVVPWIDYWVIADTGSTDETRGVIQAFMESHAIPGLMVDQDWVNFAANRQGVMELARLERSDNGREDGHQCDYAIWIDADEVLVGEPTGLDLTLDGYTIPVDYDGLSYSRLAITRLDKGWRWTGPVHEVLTLEGAVSGNLAAPKVKVHHDGARSKDPLTYKADAALFERALEEDPGNTRYWFYYAQSLRDAGLLEAARDAYTERINLGGWDQEVYCSLLYRARIHEGLGYTRADNYLDAANFMPARAEAWVEAARIERVHHERYTIGTMYARRATALSQPGPEALFVETAAYEWRCWDELTINAWWAGEKAEALRAARIALAAHPDDERLMENLRLCEVSGNV